MIRERFSGDLKLAIKTQDATRVSTLRLISAAIKERDIACKTCDSTEGVSDGEITDILARMIKQREASAKAYEEGGRLDLAQQELDEIAIIREYMPKQMSEPEVKTAIAKAIEVTGAASIRDLGKVMSHLKANHTGRMDFARACASLKDAFH